MHIMARSSNPLCAHVGPESRRTCSTNSYGDENEMCYLDETTMKSRGMSPQSGFLEHVFCFWEENVMKMAVQWRRQFGVCARVSNLV